MPFLARFNGPKDILHSRVNSVGIAEGLVLVIRGIHTVQCYVFGFEYDLILNLQSFIPSFRKVS